MSKSAEQTLLDCQTAEEAMALFDNQNDPRIFVGLHTAQGAYIDVTQSFLNHSGYRSEQLIGESAYSFFHPEDMKAILKSHASITLKPQVSMVEYRLRKADNTYALLRTYSKQLPPEENDGMIVTITELL